MESSAGIVIAIVYRGFSEELILNGPDVYRALFFEVSRKFLLS